MGAGCTTTLTLQILGKKAAAVGKCVSRFFQANTVRPTNVAETEPQGAASFVRDKTVIRCVSGSGFCGKLYVQCR
jgi:hypothetical protein